jgi:hypothetical protein
LLQSKFKDEPPQEFSLYMESELTFLKSHRVQFNTNKLEVEYDNDTDEEQISDCRDMLRKELWDVVQFFVKDDPLKIIENLNTFY